MHEIIDALQADDDLFMPVIIYLNSPENTNGYITDEDSGAEDTVSFSNQPRSQLRPAAQIVYFCDKYESQDNGSDFSDDPDLFDCRSRDWYVEASCSSRDLVILLDSTGSMTGQKVDVALRVLETVLAALSPDDHVNVFQFSNRIIPVVPCFGDELVPAIPANTRTFMRKLKSFKVGNQSALNLGLEKAVRILENRKKAATASCQQGIVILADDMPEDWTELMNTLNKRLRARVFVFLFGDHVTTNIAESMACEHDGMFALLATINEAAEQAMRMLRVFERPLVEQRKIHPIVWSGQFAHVQDQRTSDERWRRIQNEKQKQRYAELRWNKLKFLSEEKRAADYKEAQYATTLGHYVEHGSGVYELQISVSMPVFDPTRYENITITLMEDLQRNSTKRYRVARLLGVAGVDLPHRHLKLRLPYYKLGPGGAIFMIDHRGNVVLHEGLRPVIFDKVLKPNYKAVNLMDVELPDDKQGAFNYSEEFLKFRNDLLMKENGTTYFKTLQVFDNRWRILSERRIYVWRRLLKTGYTVVVSVPQSSARRPFSNVNPTLKPETALKHLLDENAFSIHPDWLYCRHIEKNFATRESELLFFLRFMNETQNFEPVKLQRIIAPLKEILVERPYMCNMDLLRRLCRDAIETSWFMGSDAHGFSLPLGPSTAFLATESGLTRWYHVRRAKDIEMRDLGRQMPRGPNEPWYRRMTLAGPNKLVLASGGRGWILAGRSLRNSAVAGYQITSEQLTSTLIEITEPQIKKIDVADDCSSDDWRCLIINDNGWILAGAGADAEYIVSSQHAVHLATLHPLAMKLMLEAGIFESKTVIDYQAVCFRLINDGSSAPGAFRGILRHAVNILWTFFFEFLMGSIYQVTTIFGAPELLKIKTTEDPALKQKKLYDKRVLVNRSTLEGCARASRMWTLGTEQYALAQRRRPLHLEGCKWPLIISEIPGVDALFLAYYSACPDNEPKEVFDRPEVTLNGLPPSCIPRLPIRPTYVPCFAHRYEKEKEFRRCNEPVIPDITSPD